MGTCHCWVPYKIEQPKAGAEYFVRVSFTLKEKTLWADKGYEVVLNSLKLAIKPFCC
jgi:beta-galactosidase